MSLFTQAIEQVQAAAIGWPVAVVSRETSITHIRPGVHEVHLICRKGGCEQSVFRLHPMAYDPNDMPIEQTYEFSPQLILNCTAAHIRQCHEAAISS